MRVVEGGGRAASVPGLEPRSIFRGKNIVITPQSRAPPLPAPDTAAQQLISSAVDSNGWVAPGRSTTDQTSPTHSWQEGEAEVEPRSIFRGKNLSSRPIVAPCPATPAPPDCPTRRPKGQKKIIVIRCTAFGHLLLRINRANSTGVHRPGPWPTRNGAVTVRN